MAGEQAIRRAARVLERGGIIAYPTEGVFGLGCMPDDAKAVKRILDIKERDAAMGLIIIVSDPLQLAGWVEPRVDKLSLPSSADKPVTWIVEATEEAPPWIRGEHSGLAVRHTRHPTAAALCDAVDAPLVSTSANVSGHPPARNKHVLRRQFGTLVDYVVPGDCGGAGNASEIRDHKTGKVLRPG